MCADKMHADEFEVDESLVRRMVAAQFPQWADLPVKLVESSGTVNAIYRLGDDLSVRIPRRPGDNVVVEEEQRWLARLAPLLPVPIPAAVGIGRPTEEFPREWAVHRWIEGENPSPDRLTAPDLLAQDLAAFVAAFRRIDLPDGPPAYRGGPLTSQDSATRLAIEQLRGMVDTDAVTAAWDVALHTPAWDGPSVWVHSDLMPGNLLVVDGRLSAVIDFETAGVGDPACDLLVAWNLLPVDARARFRTALDIDDDTWARGRGRALSMSLIALPYYQDTNPAMASNARHVIREVLADHERTS